MVAAAAPNRAAMAAPERSPSSARATCGSRAAAASPAQAARMAGRGLVGSAPMRARASAKCGSGRSGASATAKEACSTASSTARARRDRSASRTSAMACHGRLPIPSSRMASRSDWAAARLAAPSCSRPAFRRACHSSSTRAGEMPTGSMGRWSLRNSSGPMLTPGATTRRRGSASAARPARRGAAGARGAVPAPEPAPRTARCLRLRFLRGEVSLDERRSLDLGPCRRGSPGEGATRRGRRSQEFSREIPMLARGIPG